MPPGNITQEYLISPKINRVRQCVGEIMETRWLFLKTRTGMAGHF